MNIVLYLRNSFVVVTLLVLSACSYLTGDDGYFRDKKADYMEAKTTPRIRVPRELDSYTIDDLLVIPEIESIDTEGLLATPRPRPLVEKASRGVIVQKMAGRSWIVIDASPSQVWPRLRDYWASNNIGLSYENPSRGILDTQWVQVDGEEGTNDKFRIKIESGLQTGTTEIYVIHLAVSSEKHPIGEVNWPTNSTNPETETKMLNEISVYLANTIELYQAASVSLLAGSIPDNGKASLQKLSDGKEYIKMDVKFERAWASVGNALRKADFIVNQKNEDSATYDVVFVIDEKIEEEKGFFGRLFGSADAEPEQYTLRITLTRDDSSVNVVVENIDTTDQDKQIELQALQKIKNHLS